MTFLRDAPELFSTLSNDSSTKIFGFNFDCSLVTSGHCSFALSSNKHHACTSSSSSCTSSLMSPSSYSTAIRLLFQLPWCNLPPSVQFSWSSSKLWCHLCHLSLALLLLSCLQFCTTVPSQRDSLLFHPCAVEIFLYTPTRTLSSIPSTFGTCLFRGTLLALQVQMFFLTLLRMLPRHRFLRSYRSPLVRSLSCRMCRDLVFDDVLQRDEQFFAWQCGATESIVQQTLGRRPFFTARVFSSSRIFPNLPSYLFVSLMKSLRMSSNSSTSFARSRSLMLLISASV